MIGPILRSVSFETRRAIIARLIPRTLILMPTLSIVTSTAGWFLAVRMGFLDLGYPEFWWVIAALAIVTVLTVQGLGYLLRPICVFISRFRSRSPTAKRSGAGWKLTCASSRCRGPCRSPSSPSWRALPRGSNDGVATNTHHIQTTHIGSLPRPHSLLDLLKAKYSGQSYDENKLNSVLTQSVADCVREQVECGIEVVTDGEYSKPGFFTYVRERFDGYESRPNQKLMIFQQEIAAFPEYYAQYFKEAMMGGAILPLGRSPAPDR